jgi:hypothetical protein
VLALSALTDSSDVDGARTALRRYLKGGEITLTPEPFGDSQAYVARAELDGGGYRIVGPWHGDAVIHAEPFDAHALHLVDLWSA